MTWTARYRELGAEVAASIDPLSGCGRLVVAPSGYGKTRLLRGIADGLTERGIPVTSDPRTAPATPGVILVDDLDRRSDAELDGIVDATRGPSQVVIAATGPRQRRPRLRVATAAITAGAPPIRLGPFSPTDIDDVLTGLSGHSTAAVAQRIHTVTGGLPWLVETAAAHLTADPVILDKVVAGEIRNRLWEYSETEVSGIVLLSLDPSIGTTDIAAALRVDYARAADIIDTARCSGLLDAGSRLTAEVHRQAAVVLGRTRLLEVENGLATLLASHGGVSDTIATRLAADGIERSPATRIDTIAGRLLTGDAAGVGTALDPLWDTIDDAQRTRAVDLAATAAVLRGDAQRCTTLLTWAHDRDASATPGTVTHARWATIDAVNGHIPALLDVPMAESLSCSPRMSDRVDQLTAQGLAASVGGGGGALHTLLAAANVERDCLAERVRIESSAAIAAQLALHRGQPATARSVLRKLPADLPALYRHRQQVLLAWVSMVEGDLDGPSSIITRLSTENLCPREELATAILRVGLARRRGDDGGLEATVDAALDLVAEHHVDLFSLLFIGELWVAAAQTRRLIRLEPSLAEASELVAALGPMSQWSTAFHWSGVHAAIAAGRPDALIPHARALAEAGRNCTQAAALAQAGRVWVEVLGGDVDGDRVDAAARHLDENGYTWDAARLAGHAALRAPDPRVASAMLQLARSLRTHRVVTTDAEPSGGSPMTRLSEREREVGALLLSGITYRDIGERLFISAKTVEHHVARIKRRLGAETRTEMLATLRSMQLSG